MQLVAEGWLVYRLTDSAFSLGLVGFIAMVPLAPWTLVAGALADRMPRRTLLTLTQLGQVFPPLLLAVLAWSNQVQVWHVVAINVLMGALSALDHPARQAMVVDTAQPEDLDSAIALSATGVGVARVIGPAAAGVLIATLGETVCFAVNGISFLAMALVTMRLPKRQMPSRRSPLLTSLMDGGRYLVRERVILALIGLMLIVNLFIMPYQTLLPVFARDILVAGVVGLGLLTSAAGVGAIVSSLGVANLPSGQRGLLTVLLGVVACVAILGFALSRNPIMSCLVLTLVSGAVAAIKVLSIIFVQRRVRDDLRGRAMSIVVLFEAGVPRLGGLGAGYLTVRLGAPLTLGLGALGCLVCGIALNLLVPQLRRLP
jgi:predicted MFS family arabinose efflux permease